jgi:hypothetical protein
MTNWTLAQARRDYEIGFMSSFKLVKAPMQEGWQILLRAGPHEGPLVDARQKQPRVFATLDGALETLQKIGFKVEYLSQT